MARKHNSVKQFLNREIYLLLKFKQTDRPWHLPLLASLCMGIPLLTGWYFHNLQSGLLACLAGLVILYLPSSSLPNQMITLLTCSFGFMISFAIGICFSFDPMLSAVCFGLFAMAVHWISLNFRIKPPGSFFFIMIASMASCMPYNLQKIPEKIGLVGLGTMFACLLALCYGLLTATKTKYPGAASTPVVFVRNTSANVVEAIIMGVFMFASLLSGHLLKLQNPYWVPISCLAVMQGTTLYHIWQKGFHRILGTFIGLGFTWFLLSFSRTPLSTCICIIFLQFMVEMLLARNYTLAVIFITPMTILLNEAANPLVQDPDKLFFVRFWDIALGSAIGGVGGWFIHHEKIRYHASLGVRRMGILMKSRYRKNRQKERNKR